MSETRELKDRECVPFVWMTPLYGRAEFSFCPVWKDGRLEEVWITPLQQADHKLTYVIRCSGADSFQVGSWSHKGLEQPWHWIYCWCQEHGCMAFRIYVPPESGYLQVHAGSTVAVMFEKGEPQPEFVFRDAVIGGKPQ